MIRVFFDGLCEPRNPGGWAIYGFVVFKDDEKIHEEYGLAGKPGTPEATNNIAEYSGILKALEWLEKNGHTGSEVEICGDSQLVVKQLSGEFRIKNPGLKPLFARVVQLKQKFPKINVKWVPREENKEANRLTKLGYNVYSSGAQ